MDQFTQAGFEVKTESESQPIKLLLRVLLGALAGNDRGLLHFLLNQLGIELLKTLQDRLQMAHGWFRR